MVPGVEGSSPFTHPKAIKSGPVTARGADDGVSPSGKARDFDSRIRRFESCHPSQNCGPLAQMVEHLTFNQGVPGSNPGWTTRNLHVKRLNIKNAPLAQLVEQLTLNQWAQGSSP